MKKVILHIVVILIKIAGSITSSESSAVQEIFITYESQQNKLLFNINVESDTKLIKLYVIREILKIVRNCTRKGYQHVICKNKK